MRRDGGGDAKRPEEGLRRGQEKHDAGDLDLAGVGGGVTTGKAASLGAARVCTRACEHVCLQTGCLSLLPAQGPIRRDL